MAGRSTSRRDLLKLVGAGAGGVALGLSAGCVSSLGNPASRGKSEDRKESDGRAPRADHLARTSFEHNDSGMAGVGDLSTVSAAISKGSLRVTFVGDSIFEGVSQISYKDSPVGRWIRLLKDQNPDLEIRFSNLSIPGQGLYQLRHPKFVGGEQYVDGRTFAMRESPADECRWPGGTVIGKSWWDHVKDSEPDLLVFGFGMNHIVTAPINYNPTTITNAQFYREFHERMRLWKKFPSVAATTSILPTRRADVDGGIWPRLRMMVSEDAEMVRAICKEMSWTCIDANRWWSIAADAVDPVRREADATASPGDISAGWSSSSGSWLTTGNGSIAGAGELRATEKCNDLYLRFRMKVRDGKRGSFGAFWRDRGDHAEKGKNRYELLVSSCSGETHVESSWQGVPISSVAVGPTKETHTVEISVKGANHSIYVDGIRVLEFTHMGNMGEGYHGVFSAHGDSSERFEVEDIESISEKPLRLPIEKRTDEELLGLNDWYSNQKSLGGGLTNHPSILGVKASYVPAFYDVARAIRYISDFSGNPPDLSLV
jgi:hypothetical protein